MSLTTVRAHIVKHHKYAWVFTVAALLVIGGVYFKKEFSQAATFTFTQTSWSGGASATTAVHPGNQSNWNKYDSLSSITAGSTLSLPSSSYTATDDGIFSTTGSATGGGWGTHLLLHTDGTDGSTTFTDETGKTVTAYGNAQIDTAQSKFGGASALFDGTGDYLSLDDSADWDMTASDATIDFWVKFNTLASGHLISTANNTSNTAIYNYTNGAIAIGRAGVNELATAAGVVTTGVWYHIAITRTQSTGVTKIYVGGVEKASATTAVWDNSSQPLTIGRGMYSSTAYAINGWMDEIRISKGIVRWTSGFTPPTSAYSDSTNTAISGSGAGASVGLSTLPDGSTTFTDETGKTVTAVGNAQIDTAQSKFGGASGLFDGTGDYISLDDSEDWNFGTGDFTIDFWLKRNETGTDVHNVFGQGNSGLTGGYHVGQIRPSTSKFQFGMNDETYTPITATGITDTNWHHIAIVRNGNNIAVALDGTFGSNVNVTGITYTNSPGKFAIGQLGEWGGSFHNGWIDEFRVSKGIARWTANFTPPTSAYGADSNTKLLLHNGNYPSSGTFESATIDLGGKANLGNLDFANTTTPSSISTWSQTSDGDFTAGTNSSTAVSGGSVGLGLNAGAGVEIPTSTSGLIGLWHMNNDWTDSKAAKNGVAYNGATFGTAKIGTYSGSFDGVDDYVLVNPANTDLSTISTITFELWVKRKSDAAGGIFQQADVLGDGAPGVYFRSASGDFTLYSRGYLISTPLTLDTWHHIVVTNDGSVWKLYKDGVFVGSYNGAYYGVDWNGRIYFGNGFHGYFNGDIDEFAIYNRVLTESEIQNHYSPYAASGTYTSPIKPVGQVGFGTMSWSATLNGQSVAMKVRSCNDSACSGETSFASLPNVTSGQDISSLTGVSDSDGYIQYQATLTTADTTVTPKLDSVTINITPFALQVATSDSSSGPWTYYGPDGATGTYFTSSGTAIPSALSGKQYFRYKAYLATADTAYTPSLDSLTVNYTQYATTGTLTSSKYDAGSSSNVIGNVSWVASGTTGERTVRLQVRSATTAEGLDTAPWCGQSSCSGSTYFTTSGTSNSTLSDPATLDHQWFQYKVFLDGDGAGTPTVSSVTVQYVVNAPPLAGNVLVSQISDPANQNYNKVVFTYDVSDEDTSTGVTVNTITPTKFEYSTNGGNSWTEITSGLSANAFTNITLSGNSATSTSPTIVWDPTGINVATSTAKIRVTISDNEAANFSATAISEPFTLDAIVPVVATNLNSSTAGATAGTITFTATDFSTMQYRLCNDNSFPTTDTQGNSCAWSSASDTYASTTVTSHVLTGYPSNETVYMEVRDLYGNTTAKTLVAPAMPDSFDYKDVSNVNIDVYREFLSWALFTDVANSTFASYKVYEAHTADGSTPSSGDYSVLTTITDRAVNYYTHNVTTATTSTYFYKVVAVDTNGDISQETEVKSDIPNGTGGQMEVAPVITDTPTADVSYIKNTSARIIFTTDILATSTVEYGTSPSYGSIADEISFTKNHSVYLNNLAPSTTYYLRAKAGSVGGQVSDWMVGISFSTVSGPVITGVTTMDITDKNATIFWNTSASSTSKVYYGTGRSGNTLTGQVTVSGADAVTAGTNGLYQHQVGIPTTGTLTAGVTYYYKVESTSRDGQNITTTDDNNGQFYSFATTLDTTAPVISNIEAAVVSSASAVIVWTTDEPATSQVKWSGAQGNHSKRTETEMTYANVPAYTVYHVATLSAQTDNIGEGGGKNTLSPEISYYYTVVSADSAGNETESVEQTFTTTKTGETVVVTRRITETPEAGAVPDTTPPTISNVKVSDITPFSATVTFDTDEGAVGKIGYGKDASYGDNASDDFSWATAHTIKLRGLTLGTEYHVKVTAVDKAGNIGTGNDLTFKTTFLSENLKDLAKIENIEQFQKEIEETIESILPSLVPPFVSKPAVADITETSAAISFRTNIRTFPLIGFVEDAVYDATKDNPYTSEVSDTTEKATSHTLALLNLKPNTKYHIQARAFSLPQVVGKSDDLTFTTKASKIQGSIVERKRDSFTVVWITDEPTSSIVEYKNLKSGITERKTDAAMTSSHSMKIENLPSATTYEVNISGVNAQGNVVEAGTALSVTTSKDVTAPILSNFKVSNAMVPGRTDRIQTIISWTTDEPADAVVYYEEGIGTPGDTKELANKSALTDSLTLSHAIIISALKPGTIYRIKVSSTDESGNTGIFGPRTIITPKQTESITDIIFKNFEDSFKFLRDL